jgi:hypothetical protein
MPTQTRTTLKGYFTKGSIPTENNFADLIDSTLIQTDDGLLTSATAPLSIKAVGADEGLINFYRVESGQKPNTTTWQIKHLPVGSSTPGLSIGTPAATRLFIDNTIGNVGIGTETPGFPLTIGNNTLGDKISLWGQSGAHYGFGIQGYQLQIHTDGAGSDVVFGYGSSGSMTETMRIKGNGNVGIGTPSPAYGLDVKSKGIKLGLEGNGGGQLIIANDANDNKIFLEAFNAAGNGSAAELLLTGRFGGNVPRLSVNADQTWINGGIYAANSDIYFTNVGHNHSGFGNTAGFAAIENAANYGALMILGRNTATSPSLNRVVKLWDYLQVNGRLDVTGNVTIAGSLMQQDWQAVAFQNGWHNYAGGYNDAGYFKDSMGIVHLRGLVAGGGLNTIFVLPTGYRPGARQLFVCSTNPNVAGRVDVTTAGEVTVVVGNSGWLSLDGLTFRV